MQCTPRAVVSRRASFCSTQTWDWGHRVKMRSATFSINSQSRLGKFNVRNRDISVLIKIREHFKMFILNFQHFLVALKKKKIQSIFVYSQNISKHGDGTSTSRCQQPSGRPARRSDLSSRTRSKIQILKTCLYRAKCQGFSSLRAAIVIYLLHERLLTILYIARKSRMHVYIYALSSFGASANGFL